jgi:hypothetical protein
MEYRRNDEDNRIDQGISDQLLRPPVHSDGLTPRNVQPLLRVPPADRAQSGIGNILNQVAGIANAMAPGAYETQAHF